MSVEWIRLHRDRAGIEVDGPESMRNRIRELAWDATSAKVVFFMPDDRPATPTTADTGIAYEIYDARRIPEDIRHEVNPETHPENPGKRVITLYTKAEAHAFMAALAYLLPGPANADKFYMYGRRTKPEVDGADEEPDSPPKPPGQPTWLGHFVEDFLDEMYPPQPEPQPVPEDAVPEQPEPAAAARKPRQRQRG